MTPEEIEKILRKRKPSGRDIAKLQIHDIVNLQKIEDGEPPEEIQPQIPDGKKAPIKQRFLKQGDKQEIDDFYYTMKVFNQLLTNTDFCKAKYMQLLKCLEIRKREVYNAATALDFYQVLSMFEHQEREEAISKSFICYELLDHKHIIERLETLRQTQETYLDAYYYLANWNHLVKMIASEREIEDLNYYQLTDYWLEQVEEATEQSNKLLQVCKIKTQSIQSTDNQSEVNQMFDVMLNWQDGKQLKTVKRLLRRAKQIIDEKQTVYYNPAFYLNHRTDPINEA